MAALNAKNLEQFDRQDGSVKSRRLSMISRKSSVSLSTIGDRDQGAIPSSNRWRRLSRAYSIGNPSFRLAAARSTDTPAAAAAKTPVRFENTYMMSPFPGTKFAPGAVEKIARQILESNLTEKVRYEPRTCSIFAQRIAEEIKMRVKELKIPRYKIACQVFIGSVSGQSQQMVSRAVWNTDTDNFASSTYHNNSLYAVALVHCTYYE